MPRALQESVRFDFVRYANCWEDADVLAAALAPGPGKRILSIASGGDNSFALAADGAEVVAADLNVAQLACTELKRAAIRALDHPDLLAFLGFRPCPDRGAVYRTLRPLLPKATADFWDARPEAVAEGFAHTGKFERYFQAFRRRALPLVHTHARVTGLLAEKTGPDRLAFYERTWNNRRWRWMFRIFFSRLMMGRLGRDPEFFRYVRGSVADRILERARYALTVLPTHANPYLEYILTGNFGRALPRYLEPQRFQDLRAGLDRVHLVLGTVQEAAVQAGGGGFDGFNLSDIFEYLDVPTCRAVWEQLVPAARPGTRVAYWNMLVPRRLSEWFPDRLTALADLSRELFLKDRAFFYSAFVVEQAHGR